MARITANQGASRVPGLLCEHISIGRSTSSQSGLRIRVSYQSHTMPRIAFIHEADWISRMAEAPSVVPHRTWSGYVCLTGSPGDETSTPRCAVETHGATKCFPRRDSNPGLTGESRAS